MPALKLQMFFSDDEGTGWSEKMYYGGSTVLGTITPLMRQLVTLRAAMLSKDTRVVWVRVQSAHNRDPLIFPYQGQAFAVGQINQDVNTITDALLVRLEATNVGYNRIFMHGIADMYVTGGQFSPDPTWLSAWNAWRAFITTGTNFLVLANVDNPQPPVQLIKGVPLPGRGWIATVLLPGTLPVPGTVRIKGSSVLGYNGVKNVLQANAMGVAGQYLMGGAAPQLPTNVTDNLRAYPQSPLSGVPVDVFYEGITSHRVGRPFGLPRGRRSTVLPLRQ